MEERQLVWYREPLQVLRELISNPDFVNEFDYVPYQEYNAEGIRQFQDMMSGDWAWKQAVNIFHCYRLSPVLNQTQTESD